MINDLNLPGRATPVPPRVVDGVVFHLRYFGPGLFALYSADCRAYAYMRGAENWRASVDRRDLGRSFLTEGSVLRTIARRLAET